MKVRISERKLFNVLKTILEQEENEWVKLTPNEFLEFLEYTDYDGDAVSQLRQFRGKNIWITGSLNVRGKRRLTSLGNVKKIDGNLDITSTEIKSINGIDVNGYISKWDTPIERAEQKRIRDAKVAEIESRREDGEWDDITKDEDAAKAQALLEYLESNGDLEFRTPEDKVRLSELKTYLTTLEQRESEIDNEGGDTTDIIAEIEVTQDEIEELENKADIYNLYPDGSHYDMTSFRVIGADYDEDHEFAVGTQDEIDRSMEDYVDGLIDEGLTNMFSQNYLEQFIDEDKVEEYAREYYEDDVRENPEIYLSDEDKELSEDQEDEISELQSKRSELYEKQSQTEDRDEYDELQEEIDNIDYEIESIRESPDGEYSEEKIDDAIEDRVYDARRDALGWLKEFGWEDRIEDFVDIDELKQSYIDNEGYGSLNSYDNSYDEYRINGEYYYVMRIN
jgi:hypothetical protein